MNPPSRPLPRALPAIVLGVAVLAFARTLAGGFLGDDFLYVARFAELPWSDWPKLFVREWSEGIWGMQLKELRPFAALSLMIESRMFGAAPMGYRLVNLAVFLCSAWLVVRLAWRYSQGDTFAALAAGLIFVLSPIQVEPVAWITGRVDLLAAAAALAFWHCAETYLDLGSRRHLAAATAALFVGVFSKEFCLIAPILLAISWLLIPRSAATTPGRRWGVIAGAAAVLVAYAIARHFAFGANATAPNSNWHDAGSWQRQLSYLGWIFPSLPFRHLQEFTEAWPVARIQLLAAGIVAATLIAAALLRRRHAPGSAVVFFGGVWWTGTILTLIVVAYFSPRHLHFGSAGLALAAGLAIGLLRHRILRTVLLAAVCIWLGAAQFHSMADWWEAGRISRDVAARLATHAKVAPPGAVILFHAPARWHTAWLFSWSAPHLAGPPFLPRPDNSDLTFAAPWNYYRPDSWSELVAHRFRNAVAQAPEVLILRVRDDGTIVDRSHSGQTLLDLRSSLNALPAKEFSAQDWQTWIQSMTP